MTSAARSIFPYPEHRTLAQVDRDEGRFGAVFTLVRESFVRLVYRDRPAARALLQGFGVEKFSDLRPGDIEQFDIALDRVGAA